MTFNIWVNNYFSKMNVKRIAQHNMIRLIFKLKSIVNTTSTYINNRLCLLITLYSIKYIKLGIEKICMEYL